MAKLSTHHGDIFITGSDFTIAEFCEIVLPFTNQVHIFPTKMPTLKEKKMKIELHNGLIYLTETNPNDMKTFIFNDMLPYHSAYLISVQTYDGCEFEYVHILRKYLYSFLISASKEANLIIIKGAEQ